MKKLYLLLLLLTQFSCIGKAQESRILQGQPIDSIQSDTLTLLFAGDLMQHTGQIEAARTRNGYDYSSYFKYIKSEIERHDFAIGNLEVTLGGKPYTGYPAFSAPDEYLTAIKEAGFNVLLTANNHSLDRRKKGLERTIQLLDSLRIPHTGTYINSKERERKSPLILEKKGFKVALLNYTYATNGIPVTAPNIVNYIDTTVIAEDIALCKTKNTDAIIACMHWGIEYQSLPSKEQKMLADWLLQKGVTHIIGSHPHVVQPMEVRQDSVTGNKHLVVYSLGNFVSNMSVRRTDGGIMVRMELVKDSTTRLSDCGYSLVWVARPAKTGWKNHSIIPIGLPIDSLSNHARNSLNIFTNDTRSLFNKHNKGIKEYILNSK